MNKYLIVISAFCLLQACSGPGNEQEKAVQELAVKYKNASTEVMKISEKIAEFQASHLNAKNDSISNPTQEQLEIPCPRIHNELENLKTDINQLIENWGESSNEVDRLTNEIGIGKWTDEDQINLKNLKLEVDLKEAQIEKWNAQADSLIRTCGM